jgi:hypothetical protein
MMPEDLRKRLDDTYAAMRDMFSKGQIEANTYYKTLVCIAYEYAMDEELDVAVSLLDECAVGYFGAPIMEQMDADPAFLEVATVLANALVEHGVVSLAPSAESTQTPAEA